MSTDTNVKNGWITDKNGHKFHFKDNVLHNEDGPAVIGSNGDKIWYINGKLHRDDGPAVIYSDGDKVWYNKGNRHREDGPAVIDSDGTKKWYINDKKYSFKDYCKELNLDKEQILKLTLKYNL